MQDMIDVAIVGGGPGGLAAAHAILRARPDLTVKVFERSAAPSAPRGGQIAVLPNGVRALEAINPSLSRQLCALDAPPAGQLLYSSWGQLIREEPPSGSGSAGVKALGPAPLVAWHRLLALLAGALPTGVLQSETALASYREREPMPAGQLVQPSGQPVQTSGIEKERGGPGGEEACVELEVLGPSGTQTTVRARLLVGCDGAESTVRRQLLQDGPPHHTGTVVWRGVLPLPKWWPGRQGMCFFGDQGHHLSSYVLHSREVAWEAHYPLPTDQQEGEALEPKASVGRAPSPPSSSEAALQRAGERWERAQRAFQGGSWCMEVGEVISATHPLAITEHRQCYREPQDCQLWGRGRVTLLGDAAHPATPLLAQAASQALEDALELGRAIGQLGPVPEALRLYESVRQPANAPAHTLSVDQFKRIILQQSTRHFQPATAAAAEGKAAAAAAAEGGEAAAGAAMAAAARQQQDRAAAMSMQRELAQRRFEPLRPRAGGMLGFVSRLLGH